MATVQGLSNVVRYYIHSTAGSVMAFQIPSTVSVLPSFQFSFCFMLLALVWVDNVYQSFTVLIGFYYG